MRHHHHHDGHHHHAPETFNTAFIIAISANMPIWRIPPAYLLMQVTILVMP